MENKILAAAIAGREYYDRVLELLTTEDFSDSGKIVFSKIQEFYERDSEAKSVDVDLLLPQFEREYPKHFEMFAHMLRTLPEVSSLNLLNELREYKQSQLALTLSSALLSSKKADIHDLIEQYLYYEAVPEATEENEVYINTPVNKLVESFRADKLIRIWPLSFNDQLDGGVPPQTHIVLFAPPETGKSLFSINAAAGACKDGHKVVYVGNEDPAANMMMRFISRMSGLNKQEVMADPDRAYDKALEEGYENLIFVSLAGGTMGQITKHVKNFRPDMLVVDQIRHIQFPGVTGEVEQLTRAGKGMRDLGKRFNPVVISVNQAGDSASGKRVLDRSDVYMSKTSLPGDADILLGIGANEQDLATNKRTLSPCKNKINSNHQPLIVGINPQLSKVISI